MPLQQTTLENSVAKGQIAHNEIMVTNEQNAHYENIVTNGEITHYENKVTHCFQLYSRILSSFFEVFHSFAWLFSKSSAADLLYVGKG